MKHSPAREIITQGRGQNFKIFHAPKVRLYSQLVHALNNATEIVAEDLAQHFINLRRVSLAL
jgi:hypothetical protein